MATRTVNAKDIVQDIRARMDRAALIEKYHLSANELVLLLKKLVELRVLAVSEAQEVVSRAGTKPAHVFECPECGTTDAAVWTNVPTAGP